ncbi:MAG: hydroxyacylglutathione hydrolase [Gammaproteobacteria bacterium]|jgi:hydroxyacylglutathione hydrolase
MPLKKESYCRKKRPKNPASEGWIGIIHTFNNESQTMSDSGFKVHALELGPMLNFVYLIEDCKTGKTAVVDPAWEVDEIFKKADSLDLTITDILLTHSHHDHINGIEGILERENAEVHLLKPEYEFWKHDLDKPSLHHGGDELVVGDTNIKMLHTPGHTPGSACYQLGNEIITGDTLFVFGCGRCDMSGGSPEQMFETLNTMKDRLAQDMIIHPGHNYSVKKTCTLSEQIEGNPFMHYDDEESFVHYRMGVHDKTRDEPYDSVSKQQLRISNLL